MLTSVMRSFYYWGCRSWFWVSTFSSPLQNVSWFSPPQSDGIFPRTQVTPLRTHGHMAMCTSLDLWLLVFLSQPLLDYILPELSLCYLTSLQYLPWHMGSWNLGNIQWTEFSYLKSKVLYVPKRWHLGGKMHSFEALENRHDGTEYFKLWISDS